MADRHDASEEDENKLQSKVERSQFGVSKKPKNPVAEEFRAPMNSSELSKGPEELTEQRGTKVNWRVLSSLQYLSWRFPRGRCLLQIMPLLRWLILLPGFPLTSAGITS